MTRDVDLALALQAAAAAHLRRDGAGCPADMGAVLLEAVRPFLALADGSSDAADSGRDMHRKPPPEFSPMILTPAERRWERMAQAIAEVGRARQAPFGGFAIGFRTSDAAVEAMYLSLGLPELDRVDGESATPSSAKVVPLRPASPETRT